MASVADGLSIVQTIVVAVILVTLVLYQPALPRWAMLILSLYILIGLAQILASLQGTDRYYFLYSLSMGILLLLLYLYYIR